jgi:hypothetical protein
VFGCGGGGREQVDREKEREVDYAYHIAAGATVVLVVKQVSAYAVAFGAVRVALCYRYGDDGRWRGARDGGDSGTGAGAAVSGYP